MNHEMSVLCPIMNAGFTDSWQLPLKIPSIEAFESEKVRRPHVKNPKSRFRQMGPILIVTTREHCLNSNRKNSATPAWSARPKATAEMRLFGHLSIGRFYVHLNEATKSSVEF